jgi:hypothetical protein
MTGSLYFAAVISSWMFMSKLPSPAMLKTLLPVAIHAPIAAGRPKPIAPNPPLVMNVLGSSVPIELTAEI